MSVADDARKPAPPRWPRAFRLAFALACVSASSSAGAQVEGKDAPADRADRLFRDGKAALEAGRFDEACPKLASSQRLDPGTGTLLALALCHEGLGANATAVREFREVAAASEKGRPDRAALATLHAQSLEAHLATFRLIVPPGAQSRLHIRVDGTEVLPEAWASAVPTDPGDHLLEADAPGVPTWTKPFHVNANGDAATLEVPSLDAGVVLPSASVDAREGALRDDAIRIPQRSGGSARHTLGWVALGLGVVSVAVGTGFGVSALADHSDATKLCPSSPCSSSAGVSDNHAAKTDAWIANVGFGVGLASLGTAAYLLFTRNDRPKATSAARITPVVGPGAAGISLSFSF